MLPNAVVIVTRSDTSRMDASRRRDRASGHRRPGQPPDALFDSLRPRQMVDNHTCSVGATFTVEDQLACKTDTTYWVITSDSGLIADQRW